MCEIGLCRVELGWEAMATDGRREREMMLWYIMKGGTIRPMCLATGVPQKGVLYTESERLRPAS